MSKDLLTQLLRLSWDHNFDKTISKFVKIWVCCDFYKISKRPLPKYVMVFLKIIIYCNWCDILRLSLIRYSTKGTVFAADATGLATFETVLATPAPNLSYLIDNPRSIIIWWDCCDRKETSMRLHLSYWLLRLSVTRGCKRLWPQCEAGLRYVFQLVSFKDLDCKSMKWIENSLINWKILNLIKCSYVNWTINLKWKLQ